MIGNSAPRVLFIAPASLPVDGPEAIVNVKLLKELINAGYEVDVISRKNVNSIYPRREDCFDDKLHKLSIIEVDNKISFKVIWLHILTFIKFGVVYKGAHWAYLALATCIEWVSKNHYDLVITKSFPSELIGAYLKKKFNVKWVATWNDPFPEIKYPFPYGKGTNAFLPFWESKILYYMEKLPDMHIFPSDRLRDYMMQYLHIPIEKTMIIPHVCNFEQKLQMKKTEGLRMIHTGNVCAPRDPLVFLKGVSQFVKENPTAELTIDFIGKIPADFFTWLVDLKLTNIVHLLPPMDYSGTLRLVREYDVAIIIEAPCEKGIFLPTKVSDYMQNEKEIFAVSPSVGVLNDLFKKGSIRFFASCDNLGDIKRELERIYATKKNEIWEREYTIEQSFTSSFVLKQYNKLLYGYNEDTN